MCGNVPVEVALLPKPLVADVTLVGPLAAVALEVALVVLGDNIQFEMTSCLIDLETKKTSR